MASLQIWGVFVYQSRVYFTTVKSLAQHWTDSMHMVSDISFCIQIYIFYCYEKIISIFFGVQFFQFAANDNLRCLPFVGLFRCVRF